MAEFNFNPPPIGAFAPPQFNFSAGINPIVQNLQQSSILRQNEQLKQERKTTVEQLMSGELQPEQAIYGLLGKGDTTGAKVIADFYGSQRKLTGGMTPYQSAIAGQRDQQIEINRAKAILSPYSAAQRAWMMANPNSQTPDVQWAMSTLRGGGEAPPAELPAAAPPAAAPQALTPPTQQAPAPTAAPTVTPAQAPANTSFSLGPEIQIGGSAIPGPSDFDLDKKFAQTAFEFRGGGEGEQFFGIKALKHAQDNLKAGIDKGELVSGPTVGIGVKAAQPRITQGGGVSEQNQYSIPAWLTYKLAPKAIQTAQLHVRAVASSARAILGARPAASIMQTLINATYDPQANPEDNLYRLRMLERNLQHAYSAKKAMVDYYFKHGKSLYGYTGEAVPGTLEEITPENAEAAAQYFLKDIPPLEQPGIGGIMRTAAGATTLGAGISAIANLPMPAAPPLEQPAIPQAGGTSEIPVQRVQTVPIPPPQPMAAPAPTEVVPGLQMTPPAGVQIQGATRSPYGAYTGPYPEGTILSNGIKRLQKRDGRWVEIE